MNGYLIDTNIFLEILLGQENKEACKEFLSTHLSQLYVSDFSLHSIGVILLRNRRADVFNEFVEDVFPLVTLVTLAESQYKELAELAATYKLDFDDAYQSSIAKTNKFKIVTMDSDFKKIIGLIAVKWII